MITCIIFFHKFRIMLHFEKKKKKKKKKAHKDKEL